MGFYCQIKSFNFLLSNKIISIFLGARCKLPEMSESIIYTVMIRLMLKRLARSSSITYDHLQTAS